MSNPYLTPEEEQEEFDRSHQDEPLFTGDYDEVETYQCPVCGARAVLSRTCNNVHCDEGFIDEYEDDPINFSPGESVYPCPDCYGTGTETWCSSCGLDVTLYWIEQARLEKQTLRSELPFPLAV